MKGWLRIAAFLAGVLVMANVAGAKELRFSTPGRTIYKTSETFGAALDQNRRRFVIEIALGTGPEGNLGVSLGWLLNRPHGLEFYAGFGSRYGPVLHHTLSMRYFKRFGGVRLFVGGGYLFQRHTNLDLLSHSTYGEVGHKWVVRHTYHVTLGVGLQRILHHSLSSDSVLRGPEVDPDFLARELDEIGKYRYLVTLRFSRAF